MKPILQDTFLLTCCMAVCAFISQNVSSKTFYPTCQHPDSYTFSLNVYGIYYRIYRPGVLLAWVLWCVVQQRGYGAPRWGEQTTNRPPGAGPWAGEAASVYRVTVAGPGSSTLQHMTTPVAGRQQTDTQSDYTGQNSQKMTLSWWWVYFSLGQSFSIAKNRRVLINFCL